MEVDGGGEGRDGGGRNDFRTGEIEGRRWRWKRLGWDLEMASCVFFFFLCCGVGGRGGWGRCIIYIKEIKFAFFKNSKDSPGFYIEKKLDEISCSLNEFWGKLEEGRKWGRNGGRDFFDGFLMRLFTNELGLCTGREMRFSRATEMDLISKKNFLGY